MYQPSIFLTAILRLTLRWKQIPECSAVWFKNLIHPSLDDHHVMRRLEKGEGPSRGSTETCSGSTQVQTSAFTNQWECRGRGMPHLEPVGTQRGGSEEEQLRFIHSWTALVVGGVDARNVGASHVPIHSNISIWMINTLTCVVGFSQE